MAITVAPSTSFNDLVAQALSVHSHIPPEQLIVLDNSAKYRPGAIRHGSVSSGGGGGGGGGGGRGESLAEIFSTMANLNQAALKNPSLCAGKHGPSFRDALYLAAGELAVLANGRPLRYVELGPEPWKSRAILTGMLASEVQLRQYVGVDINPESERTMREALVPIIGSHRFAYWVQDFYEASISNFPKLAGGGEQEDDDEQEEDCLTVLTNLGFQEGNDLISRVGPMLSRLTRPGDLLLSEMQVFQEKTWSEAVTKNGAEVDPIRRFYLLPEMRRFSALVGQRFSHNQNNNNNHNGSGNGNGSGEFSPELPAASDKEQSEYLFQLVPLQTEVGSVNVATTLVSVHVDGVKRYVLTNSCLKYTRDQFRRAREASGDFRVVALQETGDKSVVFQISERR